MTTDLLAGKLTIVDETNAENQTTELVTATKGGRVLSVQHSKACKVICLVDGEYVLLDALVDPYGTATLADEGVSQYNFAIPVGVTKITVVLFGDGDGDGMLDANDRNLLIQAMKGEVTLTAMQKLLLDIDGSGEINSADTVLLARALLEAGHDAYQALEW